MEKFNRWQSAKNNAIPFIPSIVEHAEKLHIKQEMERNDIAKNFGGLSFTERCRKISAEGI